MRKRSPRHLTLALAATAVAALAACGEKDEPDLASLPDAPTTPATTTAQPPTPTTPTQPDGRGDGQPDNPNGPAGPDRSSLEREAEHAVEAYLTWIDRRQGERLCTLIDEEALERLRLPRPGGGCGRSLSRSIGFRNPRGLPVFDGVQLRELATRVRGDRARVVATVAVRFSDRPTPSVDDDVIYLERKAGNWIVAKPSATLYRAIGAEVPQAALAPPR